MRKQKVSVVELPPEINQIAQDLSNILVSTSDKKLDKLLNNKEETSQIKDWEDLINKVLPEDPNKWSNKDFVHWFAKELQKQAHVPYVIEYSRDCAAIKKIKDKFLTVDIIDCRIIQNFLIWSIKNYNKLKEEINRFDLPTLNSFINEFLQHSNNTDTEEKRSIGFDILLKMEQEIKDNQSQAMINLLKQFGIPLTATFYNSQGFDAEKVMGGIDSRLKRFEENDIITLQNIMRRSIDFSPYPDWFIGLNWRIYFQTIINKHHLYNLKWWREKDYGGDFAIEYNSLKEREL